MNKTPGTAGSGGKRARRNSIDTQLFHQNKLSEKVEALKKKGMEEKFTQQEQQEENNELDDTPQSYEINHNLPEGYDIK